MWFFSAPPRPVLCRHNFYHHNVSPAAVERQQHYEYERGLVAWLEYRPA